MFVCMYVCVFVCMYKRMGLNRFVSMNFCNKFILMSLNKTSFLNVCMSVCFYNFLVCM